MILAVDVAYNGDQATAAGVIFKSWHDSKPYKEITTQVNHVEGYIPGQFYKRELPCIIALLTEINKLPDVIIIDGFVYLGSEQRDGLGKYLYNELGGRVVVIGVAKKPFLDTPPETKLYRGRSRKPLYITAVGIEQETAKAYITEMHGNYRIPTLINRVDQLCRQSQLF